MIKKTERKKELGQDRKNINWMAKIPGWFSAYIGEIQHEGIWCPDVAAAYKMTGYDVDRKRHFG